jgi:hypothetical protein
MKEGYSTVQILLEGWQSSGLPSHLILLAKSGIMPFPHHCFIQAADVFRF